MGSWPVVELRRSRVRAGRGRRWWIVLGVVLVVVLLLAVRPARVAALALLLLPALFPQAPVNPLAWATPTPARDTASFAYSAGVVEADVYQPGTPGPHAGVVLQLGARLERRDPVLVRFADALARLGVVVLVPGSDNLLAGRILPEEPEAVRRAYQLLVSRPDVDPARTGLLGFSIGGGLSVIAASEEALRDRVRFVSSLGGYFDARELLLAVGSRSIEVSGEERPWQPHPLTLEVLATQLVDTLPAPVDRALLARAFLQRQPVDEAEWASLTPAGRDARQLLEGVSREEARAIVARLPEATRSRLAAISPSSFLPGLRARLYLMHDTGDSYIPFSETRLLAASAPAGTLQRYVETSIFEHVYPDRPVPWYTFVPELWALSQYVYAVLLELL